MAKVVDNTTSLIAGAASVFNQRNSPPPDDNPYYIRDSYGGYNTNCMIINQQTGSVIPNCVGYAISRYNEIMCTKAGSWKRIGCKVARELIQSAISIDWPVSSKPSLGAMVVWSKGGNAVIDDAGHVAIVEDVQSEDWICISESNYGSYKNYGKVSAPGTGSYFGYGWINPKTFGNLLGYIINPTISAGDYNVSTQWLLAEANSSFGGAFSSSSFNNIINAVQQKKAAVQESLVFTEAKKTVNYDAINTVDMDLHRTKQTSLLSYPSYVETPFIILKVGDYTFGSPSVTGNLDKVTSNKNVTFPNYMKSMRVVKVNGTVNQYTFNLEYQVGYGDDPNLLDKIFSSVGYGRIKISYGDWSCPNFIYKEEEAIITGLNTTVNVQNSSIQYTLTCTSDAIKLLGGSVNFPARTAKPSTIIQDILYNNTYGMLDVFYGMRNRTLVASKGLIPTDDKVVSLEAKNSTDPLTYINYLVSCMISNTNADNDVIQDSSYYMVLDDDNYGTAGLYGPYFKIVKVLSNTSTINDYDTYEVDIGYPSENMVMDFSLTNNNSWSLLYDYSDKVETENYVYKYNNNGELVTTKSPLLTTNKNTFLSTPNQKNWWTKMTQFPVSATLKIKGLVRPAMLMTYVRVNVFFFGKRHISSGLYLITKQEDSVDANGYRTTLTLTRIAGDQDYITKSTRDVNGFIFSLT